MLCISRVYSSVASTFAPNINKIERKGRKFRRMYKVSDAMDDVKEMVNGIDRRLGFHINIVSENLGKMTNLVEEVHEAIMDNEDDGKIFCCQPIRKLRFHQKKTLNKMKNVTLFHYKNADCMCFACD